MPLAHSESDGAGEKVDVGQTNSFCRNLFATMYNMKLFCSYAYTGEDPKEVAERMRVVVDTLTANGHEAYCNQFDDEVDELLKKDDLKGIFESVFNKVNENEALVAIITSPNRSIGQIIEIGVAMSQHKPFYLIEHSSAKDSSYLPRLADKHFSWTTIDDLKHALTQI